jgi:hypothetical protein
MPSKQFEEKQALEKDLPKETSQDKVTLKVEKDNLKSEKEAIGGKEHKEKEKEHYKDKDKEKELHKDKEKEHKLEGKESHLDKVPKTEGHEVYPQVAVQAGVGTQKYSALEKIHKEIKAEIKEIKPEKHEIKEFKHEKQEIKEKHEKDKLEIKEFKHEKFEKVEKFEYEGVVGYGPPGGPVEQRLAALESAVTQLLHFIPENLRPDLSQGALKQEPDAGKQGAAGAAKAPEAKEPQAKSKS